AAGQHLLNLNAFDLGAGLVLVGVGENGLVALFSLSAGLDADHDAAGLGLVQDVRRDDFHHYRKTHAGRDLGGVCCRFGHGFLRNRNSVGVAHQLAFLRRQTIAFVRLDLIEYVADRVFGIRHWIFLLRRLFYGIWYARDDPVKTSHYLETPKTRAT